MIFTKSKIDVILKCEIYLLCFYKKYKLTYYITTTSATISKQRQMKIKLSYIYTNIKDRYI